MGVQALLGSESVPVRRFAIAWAALGGFVLGSTLYLFLARSAPSLLLMGIVPGALSGVAVARATRRRCLDASGAIVGTCVLAAMFVPFTTLALALAWSTVDGWPHAMDALLMFVCIGSAVGAFFSAPLGLAFGAVYAFVWRRLDASRASGRSALELLWMRFGGAFIALGASVLVLSRVVPHPYAYPFDVSESHDLLIPLGVGTLVFGMVTALRGLLLARARRRLARLARAGELAGHAVVPASEVAGAEALPDLFGRDGVDVLVRREPHARGPFRSAETILPLARL